MPVQRVYLIRHGETEWSLNKRHTGITDIPLTENGRAAARRLKAVLSTRSFALVLTSPLQRARETCELAGLGFHAEIDNDLKEWNYGDYEGLTPSQIEQRKPGWLIFTDGCPNGERPEQVGARIDRLMAKIRAVAGDVALFAHGHLLRTFGARWLGLPPEDGAHFLLDPATVSVASFYHGVPAMRQWNVPVPSRTIGGQRMSTVDLESTAKLLVSNGKGILAADETPRTLTKRFDAVQISSTPDSRRTYRDMLFSTPRIAQFIGGVIMQDETIRQASSQGKPLVDLLKQQGAIPGIKVDMGAKPLAGAPGETVTEGLDGLRDRLQEYRQMGARFAKWRAVIHIGDAIPSSTCIHANAHALARYAAICQEQNLVPIVEPEVLMDGAHTIQRCEEVTSCMLQATFDALFDQRVKLEGMLLKPNMVIAGQQVQKQASVEEVAQATLRCLRHHVPPAVPGIVFLSGGQDHLAATAHLNALNQLTEPKPWKLSFSYGRALQDEALQAWQAKPENLKAGQNAFFHRAMCVSAAALGKYTPATEGESAA
jgi:fructose-bisphosphate aldolase class I